MPGEVPEQPHLRLARGVQDGDILPAVDLGGGVLAPECVIDLAAMEMGAGSWTERVLNLRDQLGVFRLAYLEAVLRAADRRASKEEQYANR